VYGAIAAICGALFLLLAFQLNRNTGASRRAAHRLFVFSIFYLFALCAVLLVDHGGVSNRSSHDSRTSASAAGRPMLWDGEVRYVRKRGPLVVGGESSIMSGMGLRGDRKVRSRS
jgi:hypothetical protein